MPVEPFVPPVVLGREAERGGGEDGGETRGPPRVNDRPAAPRPPPFQARPWARSGAARFPEELVVALEQRGEAGTSGSSSWSREMELREDRRRALGKRTEEARRRGRRHRPPRRLDQ